MLEKTPGKTPARPEKDNLHRVEMLRRCCAHHGAAHVRSMTHLALLLSAASLPTSSGILPFAKSFEAYYVFDDGAGFDLKESVSNVSKAGRVLYESKHQTVNYTQPNWYTAPTPLLNHSYTAPSSLGL